MIVQDSNGADPEEVLAIGISFGNSNSGIAYTTAVRTAIPQVERATSDSRAGG